MNNVSPARRAAIRIAGLEDHSGPLSFDRIEQIINEETAAPDLLNLMTAATRLDELTGENLAVYARTFAALARAAIARATGNQ